MLVFLAEVDFSLKPLTTENLKIKGYTIILKIRSNIIPSKVYIYIMYLIFLLIRSDIRRPISNKTSTLYREEEFSDWAHAKNIVYSR